jgi:hypothetical protein
MPALVSLLSDLFFIFLVVLATKCGIDVQKHQGDLQAVSGTLAVGVVAGGTALIWNGWEWFNKHFPTSKGGAAMLALWLLIPAAFAMLPGCQTSSATPVQVQQTAWIIDFFAVNAGQQAVYHAGLHVDKEFAAGKIDQPTYTAEKATLKVASDGITTAFNDVAANRPWSQTDTDAVKAALSQTVLDWANAELESKGLAKIVVPPMPGAVVSVEGPTTKP